MRGFQRFRGRVLVLATGLVCFASAVVLVLFVLKDDLLFFMMPSDLVQTPPKKEKIVRLGGYISPGSTVYRGPQVTFQVTDFKAHVPVLYTGVLPDLFQEGKGIVAVGTYDPDKGFMATQIYTKHDETYMPKAEYEKMRKKVDHDFQRRS